MPDAVYIQGKRVASVKWFVMLLFLAWPLGALPFVLMEIWNRRQYAFTLLALFMGLCAVIYPPGSDLYRHAIDYYNYEELSGEAFRAMGRADLVLPYMSFLFAKTGIHFEIVRFLFVFASYSIWFYIFRDAVARNKALSEDRSWYFVSFMLVMFCACFVETAVGLRWGMSRAVTVLAAWQLLVQKRKIGYAWLLLAPMIHFSCAVYCAILLVVKTGIFRLNNKSLAIMIFIAGYLLSLVIVPTLVPALFGDGANIAVYVDGYWGTGGQVEDRSFRGRLMDFSVMAKNVLLMLPLMLFYKERSKYLQYILAIFILWGVTIPFYAMGIRIASLLALLLLFLLLLQFDLCRRYLRLFKPAVLWCGVVFLFEIYAARDYIALAHLDKMIYSPAPVVICDTFDENWIHRHMDIDGLPYGVEH